MDVRFELFSSVTVHTLFDVYALVPDVHCHSQIHAIGSRCPCAKEFFSPQQIVRIAWTMVHAGEEPTLARVELAWVFCFLTFPYFVRSSVGNGRLPVTAGFLAIVGP